jgi:hypothetical protein
VFDRILATTFPQLIVSTYDLSLRIAQDNPFKDVDVSETLEKADSSKSLHTRPELNQPYVAPETETEQTLVEIWQAFLGIEQIGIHDDFFELGGDSLLGTQVMSRIRETFQVELPIGGYLKILLFPAWQSRLKRSDGEYRNQCLLTGKYCLTKNGRKEKYEINSEFLSYLRSLDIHLWVEEERLRYNAPKGVLTQELREQLRARKTEILAFLRQANVSAHASVQPIEPIPHDQPLPLSFNQQRLWFLNQLEGPNPIYNVPMAWRIIGSLHISTLERCITEIVRRHEALRTTFADSNGTPIQKIASPWDVRLSVVDLSHLSEDEVEDETRKLAFKDIETSFDLTQGPLFRGTVFRLKSNVHVLMIVVHHIIFDVWSIGVFIKELSALYRSFSANQPSPLSDLPIQYADFAHWQNTWLSGKFLSSN